ncbi:MAG: TetR/AcrR family transcriptional regulator [Thermodesulfobacteriota bacterium]
MAKAKRNPETVAAIRQNILDEALALIAETGYRGFSMRKLGARLGIAAKTVYNYFHNQDEIYLALLTRGFENLHYTCRSAADGHDKPMDRFAAMCRAFVDFGIEHAKLYNLMFTWHVPKFKDYVDTPMEPAARAELETALTVSALFMEHITACADADTPMTEDQARFLMIRFWSQAHGYIAGINNTLLDYMHESPLAIKDDMIDAMLADFKAAMKNHRPREAASGKTLAHS